MFRVIAMGKRENEEGKTSDEKAKEKRMGADEGSTGGFFFPPFFSQPGGPRHQQRAACHTCNPGGVKPNKSQNRGKKRKLSRVINYDREDDTVGYRMGG
jgi:hypothetical protein